MILCDDNMWPAESIYPILHNVVHPYFVAPGSFRERPFSHRSKASPGDHFGDGAGVWLGAGNVERARLLIIHGARAEGGGCGR